MGWSCFNSPILDGLTYTHGESYKPEQIVEECVGKELERLVLVSPNESGSPNIFGSNLS